MGTGERIYEMEQNLRKIWILLNYNYFNLKPGTEEKKLLSMIQSYFKKTIKSPSLEEINLIIKQIKDSFNVDLLELVKDYKSGREENSDAHFVITPSGKYVFPDP